ncbi:MAG: hypothetical protein A2X64_00030 [Ignavibacteria bacterium GWF2_33_9]|nr:MAG: hypothetical protein A2X64_00030 [Ignavibacteria bacterium GWF2_33_9]
MQNIDFLHLFFFDFLISPSSPVSIADIFVMISFSKIKILFGGMMRAIYFVFFVTLFFVYGCGTTMYQLNTTCNTDVTQLFNEISFFLVEEGFVIKQNDSKAGYLQAETIPKYNIWSGQNEVRYWIFQVKNFSNTEGTNKKDNVVAYAKIAYISTNVFGASNGGSEIYYNDRTHKDWSWYWTVRRGLENICKNQIRFIEKTLN